MDRIPQRTLGGSRFDLLWCNPGSNRDRARSGRVQPRARRPAGPRSVKGLFATRVRNAALLNRIDLLWAAGELPDLIDAQTRASILSEIFGRQRADGSWSTVTLMPN